MEDGYATKSLALHPNKGFLAPYVSALAERKGRGERAKDGRGLVTALRWRFCGGEAVTEPPDSLTPQGAPQKSVDKEP